jgi:hypothetical protein
MEKLYADRFESEEQIVVFYIKGIQEATLIRVENTWNDVSIKLCNYIEIIVEDIK